MQQVLIDVLSKRRDRAIATILTVKEKECDLDLNARSSQRLRKVILDEINDLYKLMVDVLDSVDQGNTVTNEAWLDKLNDIHRHLVG